MKNFSGTLISVDHLSYQTATHALFDHLSVALNAGEKIGLIGYNGSGKTTLLRLLAKEFTPSEGKIIYANNLQLYAAEQRFPDNLLPLTPVEAMLQVLPEADRAAALWQAENILAEAGFSPEQISGFCRGLSGGLQTRLLLSRALLAEPDVLLLDEPSNHLDLPSLLWLEAFLKQWKGSFITVSHDSTLLDKVTDGSWIITDGKIYRYRLSCTGALDKHAEAMASKQRMHEAENKEIERLEASAKQLAIWGKVYDNGKLSGRAQSIFKRAERLKEAQTLPPEPYPWELAFTGSVLPAARLLTFKPQTVQAEGGQRPLFTLPELAAASGDHIALIGANGCGKSTLLRRLWQACLHRDQTVEATIKVHPALTAAYYDQLLTGIKDGPSLITALKEYCSAAGVPVTEATAKAALMTAGFAWDKLSCGTAVLSGGERARLVLTGLSLINAHVLILDEPTNHLDLQGKKQLAERLSAYKGLLILVSHDRSFIERTCRRFWAVKAGYLTEFQDFMQAEAFLTSSDTRIKAENPQSEALRKTKVKSSFSENKVLRNLKNSAQKPLKKDWQTVLAEKYLKE